VERSQSKTGKAYGRDIAVAKKRGDNRDELDSLMSQASHEYQTYEDEIHRLHTRYLWREANRLLLPVPEIDDKEAWEEEYGRRHLTRKGINDLRTAVRLEMKLRREAVLMWVPAITALTGLAGAAIGVLFTWFGLAPPK
jgi:hypothetical protein